MRFNGGIEGFCKLLLVSHHECSAELAQKSSFHRSLLGVGLLAARLPARFRKSAS
jgi:hypothetical protein